MAGPVRTEFRGAAGHVTSRGDLREPVFIDDEDGRSMPAVVEQAMDRFVAQVLSDGLMGNHYRFVLHTRQANLPRPMRHLNGVTTQVFNRRMARSGICSRTASEPFRWIATPTCWRSAARWS